MWRWHGQLAEEEQEVAETRERWAKAELQRLQGGDPKNGSITKSHSVSFVSRERASVSPCVQPGGPSVCFVSLERANVSPRVQPGGPSVFYVAMKGECVALHTAGRACMCVWPCLCHEKKGRRRVYHMQRTGKQVARRLQRSV